MDTLRLIPWRLVPFVIALITWFGVSPRRLLDHFGKIGCILLVVCFGVLIVITIWRKKKLLLYLFFGLLTVTLIWPYIPKPTPLSPPKFDYIKVTDSDNIYKPGDTIHLEAKLKLGKGGYDVWMDIRCIDTEGGTVFFDHQDNGIYVASYRISLDNRRRKGFYAIKCEAQGQDTSIGADLIKIKYDPDPPIFKDAVPSKKLFKKEDVICITVNLDEVGYRLTTDFSSIDSTYRVGEEEFNDNKDLTYTITYPISPKNERPKGTYTIPITATDLAGNISRKEISLEYDPDTPIFINVVPERKNAFRNGDTIYLQGELDEVGYKLTADFSSIDSTYKVGEEEVNDNGYCTYTIRYRINPTENTRNDGSYSVRIAASDKAENKSYYVLTNLYLDNTPPKFLSSTITDKPLYKNKDAVILTVHLDASGYSLIADFGKIDALYDPTRVDVKDWGTDGVDSDNDGYIDEDDEKGYYYISYQIHEDNPTRVGQFTVSISASDEAGNMATDSIELKLDNIPPDGILIIQPHDGDVIGNGLTTFIINDGETPDDDVDSFILQYRSTEGGSYTDVPGQNPGHWNPGGSSSITWNTADLDDGIYSFQIVVTDKAGNIFITPPVTEINMDNTAPLIESIESNKTVYTKESVVILDIRLANHESGCRLMAYFSNIDDQYKPDMVDFVDWGLDGRDNDGDGFTDEADEKGRYKLTYSISPKNERPTGTYIIPITATDFAGNTSKREISLGYDPDPPTFARVVPEIKNTFKNGDIIYLKAELDEAGYRLTTDFSSIDSTYEIGEEEVNDNGDCTYIISYRINPTENTRDDGSYSVRIIASDKAGNKSYYDLTNFYLDNTPPKFLSPTIANKSLYKNENIVILLVHLDTSEYRLIANFGKIDNFYDPTYVTVEDWGIDEVDNDNDGNIDEDDEKGYYYISYQIHENNAPKQGQFTVSVSASDEAGNMATDSIELKLDNIPPDGILIIQPHDGDVIGNGGTTFIINDGETPDDDVDSFILQYRSTEEDKPAEEDSYTNVPGQNPGHWNSGGSSSITWNTTGLVDKIYDFQIAVADKAGNVFITPTATDVEVDNTAPSPPSKLQAIWTSDQKIRLIWSSSPQNDIYKYKVYRSISSEQEECGKVIREEPASDDTEVYMWIDTDVNTEETYYYVVTAEDRAGNESQKSKQVSPL